MLLPTPGLAVDEHAGAAAGGRGGERGAQAAELLLPAHRRRPAGGGHRHRGLVVRREAWILLEDAALELAHRLAGLQAQLAQARGELAVRGERLDLPPARVQGQHQHAGELLAERLLLEQPAQHRDRLERTAELHERARVGGLRVRAQVLEAADLGLGELRVGEVAVRLAAPQPERALERGVRLGGRERGRRAQLQLEALRVDLAGLDGEPVAGALADEQGGGGAALAAGLEERAQVRDAHRQRAGGDLARDVVPARVEQRVGRDGAAGVDQQPRQDRALLGARRRQRGRRAVDLDRAQDPEFHSKSVMARGARRDERDGWMPYAVLS